MNDGLWSGQFDINGKGPYQFDVLYINGKAVAHSNGRQSDLSRQCVIQKRLPFRIGNVLYDRQSDGQSDNARFPAQTRVH